MFLHAGTDLYRDQVFLRQKLSYADNIVAVCEYNRQFIRQLYPDLFGSIAHKIYIHHLGLDFPEFPYSPHGRVPGLCLAVGYFGKVKGFDYLIRALAELRRRGVDAQVELIGDGDMASALRALVTQLGLTRYVRFLGWLPFAEVQSEMRRAAVLVHPSIGLGDAVPTVIKEAMAIGTPVVASRVAGIPELLDDGAAGVLVPPKDVVALADQLEILLADAELRRSYAVAGRVYAEKVFDLGRNGQRLAAHLLSMKRLAAG
jgi:glycosyltransferase involved in cell wall biosynthesis